jgi:allantoinase
MIWHRKIHPAIWRDTVLEGFGQLHADGRASGTVFGLHIHPWLTGQPHRIATLEAIVAEIAATSGIWRTTAGGIADRFRS